MNIIKSAIADIGAMYTCIHIIDLVQYVCMRASV